MEFFYDMQVIFTIAAILLGWAIKAIIVAGLKKKYSRKGVDKRYVINTTKNLINVIVVGIILVIWSSELQNFALSIAAFVVAIVLATREIIQCFIGFIYISSAQPFRVGDWIKSGDLIGEVTRTDWAKIVVLEVDPTNYEYTGKTIIIPNNQFMTQPIKNLNFMKRYVNHSFVIVKDDTDVNPYVLKSDMLGKAKEYCADFKDVAERYNTLIENRLEVKISGPEPTIKFSTTDLGLTKALFSIFCPTEKALEIEQKLTRDYFDLWAKEKQRLATLAKENV